MRQGFCKSNRNRRRSDLGEAISCGQSFNKELLTDMHGGSLKKVLLHHHEDLRLNPHNEIKPSRVPCDFDCARCEREKAGRPMRLRASESRPTNDLQVQ